MNQGAAVGVRPGEQCPQHQEAECERQAVGQGAYGGRRGRVRGLWRVLFQRLLMPDSPTMTPEQGRAPLATSRKTDFPNTTQEAP